jgi:hypothetical protein
MANAATPETSLLVGILGFLWPFSIEKSLPRWLVTWY